MTKVSMTKERAYEISATVFSDNVRKLEQTLSEECEDPKVAFSVGMYVGMMKSALETELSKEMDGDDL